MELCYAIFYEHDEGWELEWDGGFFLPTRNTLLLSHSVDLHVLVWNQIGVEVLKGRRNGWKENSEKRYGCEEEKKKDYEEEERVCV